MYSGLIFKAELPPGVRYGAFRAGLKGAGIGAIATAPGKDGHSQGRMPLTQFVQDRGVDAALEP